MHCPPHDAIPAEQAEHVPPPHRGMSVGQVWPQVPQLFASVVVLTQAPAQADSVAGHWQTPLMHEAPVAQTRPQLPQLFTSDWSGMHDPPQEASPRGQAEQDPPLQSGVAVMQACPHCPQFVASVIVSVHVPSQFVFPSAGHGS